MQASRTQTHTHTVPDVSFARLAELAKERYKQARLLFRQLFYVTSVISGKPYWLKKCARISGDEAKICSKFEN